MACRSCGCQIGDTQLTLARIFTIYNTLILSASNKERPVISARWNWLMVFIAASIVSSWGSDKCIKKKKNHTWRLERGWCPSSCQSAPPPPEVSHGSHHGGQQQAWEEPECDLICCVDSQSPRRAPSANHMTQRSRRVEFYGRWGVMGSLCDR